MFQISWWSVKPLLKYGDFSIVQNGGRAYLGFVVPMFEPFGSNITVQNLIGVDAVVSIRIKC